MVIAAPPRDRTGRARFARHADTDVPAEVDPVVLARRLAAAVRWSEPVTTVVRSWALLARSPEYDAWLIAWPVGGTVELHDHGCSRGAFTVIRGALVETTPLHDDDGHLTLVRNDVRAGATLAFDAGRVHDVTNEGTRAALSLHVYSPALTTMASYEIDGGRLVRGDVRWVADHTDRSPNGCVVTTETEEVP